MDKDALKATQYLIDKNSDADKNPDAQICCVRTGHRAVYRIPVRNRIDAKGYRLHIEIVEGGTVSFERL